MSALNETDPYLPAAVAPEHVEFLRDRFITVRDVLLYDLAHGRSREPDRHRHAVVQYAVWIAELQQGVLSASRGQLLALQDAVDEGNEYARVFAEHEAFEHLIRQLR
jgi:hypothetical protein